MNAKTYKIKPLGEFDLAPYTSPLEVLDFCNENLTRMEFTHLGAIHEFTQQMPFTATIGQLDSFEHSPKIVLLEWQLNFDVVKELFLYFTRKTFPKLTNKQLEKRWTITRLIVSLFTKIIKWTSIILLMLLLYLKIKQAIS